ncbi:MAG: ABC transporter substrate-binding protein [Chloroflexi bacterium]|nr:ABC transporter substrate-binding protein [Chloroflexota bacterium]
MPRFNRFGAAVVAIIGLLIFFAACNGDGESPTSTQTLDGFPVTLQGADGRQITLDGPPQRMVVLSPGHVEILFAIGAGDQVVAVEQNTDFPPEAAAVEPKLSGFEPSTEAVAELNPDLVILSFAPEGFVEQLAGLGITVFLDDIDTRITTVEGVFDSILELGRATGHAAEATELVRDLRERVAAVEEAVAGVAEGPRVYHELDDTLFTISPGTFTGDLYAKLHAENIVGAGEGLFPQLSPEAVIDRDPEVIILADAAFGQTPDVVAARPGWDVIDAVENNRVFAIDPNLVSRPGPRIVDGLEALARLLYPELFPEEGRVPCSACFAAGALALRTR